MILTSNYMTSCTGMGALDFKHWYPIYFTIEMYSWYLYFFIWLTECVYCLVSTWSACVFIDVKALTLKFLDGNFWLLLSAAKFDFVYMCAGIYLIRFYVWSWWHGFWLSIEFSLVIGYSILLIPFTVCIIMNAFLFYDL